MRALHTLDRYWRLLSRYLRPERFGILLLALILLGTIAVQVITPLATGRFIDQAVAGDSGRSLVMLALLTIALALAGQGLAVAETYVAENLSWAATNTLRVDLLAHLLRLDAGFHATHTSGELIERVDGDVSALARFFSRFVVTVVGNVLLIAGVLALLFVLDWRIGLSLSMFVAIALGAIIWIRARATPYSTRERQAIAEFYGFAGEVVTGLEDVRSSGSEAFVLRRCAQSMRAWLHATLPAQVRGYALVATGDGLFGLGAAAVLGISCMLFQDGALTIGSVYLIYRYTEMLQQPAEQIRNEVQDLQHADASMLRVESLFATEPSLRDGPLEGLPPGPLSVELNGVAFHYANGAPVIRDIDLRVEPGRVLGIVGRTGAGKTTLTRLIPRLYDPINGVVRLGGVDLREVSLRGVRSRIGVVTQDVRLFDASLRDNLTLFDDDIDDGRIESAIAELGLGSWFNALPHGLETMLSTAGLSAGEAQVLACARIMLRDPDVVIMDEASSRLDPATERQVQRALRRLLRGRTGIIIAHRLDTIALADDLLVLEDGRVIEQGPRLALAADPASRFSALLRLDAREVLS